MKILLLGPLSLILSLERSGSTSGSCLLSDAPAGGRRSTCSSIRGGHFRARDPPSAPMGLGMHCWRCRAGMAGSVAGVLLGPA